MTRTIIAILMTMCMAACTNNGDIGPLYGLWAMDGCEADGTKIDQAAYIDFYWRFQGEIVAINQLTGAHEHLEWIGTFAQAGDALELDFSEGEVNTGFYPSQIGLDAGKMRMVVEYITSSRMTLRYLSPAGVTWLYALRKVK